MKFWPDIKNSIQIQKCLTVVSVSKSQLVEGKSKFISQCIAIMKAFHGFDTLL